MADRFVLDASAVGAVLFREPRSQTIEKEIESGIWLAPTLLDYEVGSIYLKKIAKYPSLKRDLDKSYHLFLHLPIDRVEIPIPEALIEAVKHRLTIYDASYYWLAKRLHAKLVTLDKKLMRLS